ncbi:MAG: PHP domain-containing protein [Candidatus Aenigmarchaeota archaeon]|nr:PHP domain-containing protein [Candidatus Aenigmarchaeota archaeon]
MKIEMHAHTFYSPDAIVSPEEHVKTIKKRGLDATAVTDHDTAGGWKRAIAAGRKEGIAVIRAEEIHVHHDGRKIGEVLAYFINEEIKPGEFLEVRDAVKQQGGIVVAAHPFDTFRNSFRMLEEYKKHMDGIEAFNARVLLNSFNTKARHFAQANGFGITGGSDSHCKYEIAHAHTEADITDINELPKAIKNRKTRALGHKTNPFIHTLSSLTKIGLLRPEAAYL